MFRSPRKNPSKGAVNHLRTQVIQVSKVLNKIDPNLNTLGQNASNESINFVWDACLELYSC